MRISTRATATPGSIIEESGNFPNPAPVLKLMATLRSGAGVPVGLRATGNPGGPGHQWIKARYIDPAPLGNRIIRDPLTGLEPVWIPLKVDNNQHIDVEAYRQRPRACGSQELVRAWLDGDWSVTMGAFFDCWEAKRRVVAPFAIPEDWMWLRFQAPHRSSAAVRGCSLQVEDHNNHRHLLRRSVQSIARSPPVVRRRCKRTSRTKLRAHNLFRYLCR